MSNEPRPSTEAPSADAPNADAPVAPAPTAPARRGFGLAAMMLVAVLSAALSSVVTSALNHGAQGPVPVAVSASAVRAETAAPTPVSPVYRCPMHPAITQDHPGTCPICGMTLVKDAAPSGAGTAPNASPRILFYRSPMNPKQTSPVPAKDDMGMDYLPVYEDARSDAPSVAGLATVEIDPARQQLIGLRTADVSSGPVGGTWRTVGKVAIDETRVRRVNVKVSGFVERIYVDFVGKRVKKGDPLFTIFSPELVAAQEEYLLAVRTQAELAKAGTGSGGEGHLVEAARRKLLLWDVTPAEVDALASTGQPTRTLTFYSPDSGVVTKKDVVGGMKLEAGAMPYEIVDLSTVWVLADVYESELRLVQMDLVASLTLAAFPNREFKGKVAFIDPLLDPASRTVKVRLAFPNTSGDLRPEMFGDVVLSGATREGLRIPSDAVIDSGTEKVVFVAVGDGKFQPRKVSLGSSDGTNVEVVSGVLLGERVVVRANFLVDSESRLRASLAEMAQSAAPKSPESARVLPSRDAPVDAGQGHAGHEHRP